MVCDFQGVSSFRKSEALQKRLAPMEVPASKLKKHCHDAVALFLFTSRRELLAWIKGIV